MMNDQTKMIIITSNEDLIQQFSFDKSSNTRIIELDENNSTNSISKDNNNLLDLTFLAQLSELNSNNDQMYKRALDSPQTNRSKMAKTSKKVLDLLCVICNDNAIGFNYDVLTCASCKAFFRRNAQYQPEKLRCLTGEKNCSVSHEIARKCQRCRLSKCLSMGMRKDFILSEEEKQKRRQRIEENRRLSNEHQSSIESICPPTKDYISESIDEIDRLLMDTENDDNTSKTLFEVLSIDDWSDIENIRLSYSSIFENGNPGLRLFDTSDRISALVSWSEFAGERALKLIHFFKQIDEFENLNSDDRFTLIKYNLLPLFLIQKCHYYNPLTGQFICRANEDASKRRQFFALCYGTSGIRENYMNLIRSFSNLTEQDSILTNLILIILLFSKGLSMSDNEPILKNILAVHQAQSHYIKLTWNYLIYKHGQTKTLTLFIQLMREIQRIQSFTKHFRDYFRTQTQSTDVLERFAPIMQALLNIK